IGASMTGSAQSRYELGHVMSAAWAAFARTGNPNHADMPYWPPFDPERYPTMMFGETVRSRNDPNRETRLANEALKQRASEKSGSGPAFPGSAPEGNRGQTPFSLADLRSPGSFPHIQGRRQLLPLLSRPTGPTPSKRPIHRRLERLPKLLATRG